MKTLSYGGQTPTAMFSHSERPGRRFASSRRLPFQGSREKRWRFAHFICAYGAYYPPALRATSFLKEVFIGSAFGAFFSRAQRERAERAITTGIVAEGDTS